MSWDLSIRCGSCITHGGQHSGGEWNYTHNVNGMIATVLRESGAEIRTHFLVGDCWWDGVDGKPAAEALPFFTAIVAGLEKDPARFRAMNPSNGWGDYDRLLAVLREITVALAANADMHVRVSG